jgi:WD40 repeat protein
MKKKRILSAIIILFVSTSCASLKTSDAIFVLKHNERVIATSFYQAENKLATLISDGTITMWDISNGGMIGRIDTNNNNPATSLIYTEDGIIVIYKNRDMIMYDPLNIEEPKIRSIPEGSIEKFVYYPKDRRMIFGIFYETTTKSSNKGSSLEVTTPGKVEHIEDNRIRETTTSKSRLVSIRFYIGPVIKDIDLPTSRLTFVDSDSSSDRNLDDISIRKKYIESYKLTSIAISLDGIIACGLYNGEIIIYDGNTNRQLRRFQNSDDNAVTALTFSSNGRYLLSGSSDKIIRLWDRENNWSRLTQRNLRAVYSLCFSPNGDSFIADSNGSFFVVDARNGNILRIINSSRTQSIFYKKNNEIIIIGIENQSVLIW